MRQFEFEMTNKRTGRVEHARATDTAWLIKESNEIEGITK